MISLGGYLSNDMRPTLHYRRTTKQPSHHGGSLPCQWLSFKVTRGKALSRLCPGGRFMELLQCWGSNGALGYGQVSFAYANFVQEAPCIHWCYVCCDRESALNSEKQVPSPRCFTHTLKAYKVVLKKRRQTKPKCSA